MHIQPGSRVLINTPDNPCLHMADAIVESITEWGAHLITMSAATGKFRAVWDEMILPEDMARELVAHGKGKLSMTNGGYHPKGMADSKRVAKEQGYTGNACDDCGGIRMKRNGSCEVCTECGRTSGCS